MWREPRERHPDPFGFHRRGLVIREGRRYVLKKVEGLAKLAGL